jgi:tight adherence protein C
VSVEAGLAFDSAIAKVVEKMTGPLPEEFQHTLQDIRVGKQRREALKDLGERNGVPDLEHFVSSLVQADTLGVSISKVLRIQSEQMRQRRKQRAEEMAMKAPVKLIFPMIFFIFPTIFVILLGPAGLKMVDTFASMGR